MSETVETPQPAPAAPPAPDPAAIAALNASIRELINVANARQAAPVAPAPPAETETEVDPTELEAMPRAAFAQFLADKILKAVNTQVVQPINQRLDQITASTSQASIQSDVLRLGGERQADGTYKGGKYPDFWDFQQEMLSLAREHPGLPPERLYKLARVENEAKAAEVDKKHRPAPAPSGGKVRLSFGGLTPSQSGTSSKGGKLPAQEASTAAWAETVAALGGEPLFGEE